MDKCSYFIKNTAIFGGYPDQNTVNEFEDLGVKYFIDLTHSNESKITPYTTKYTYINFPIVDHYIPTDLNLFTRLILKITKIILNLDAKTKIFIHCKGGHGRAGVVISCLLCNIFNLSPKDALEYTNKCHSKRLIMKEKWRKIGSPQTFLQKRFVYKFFENLMFNRYNNYGLSIYSKHPINVPNLGIFQTVDEAFVEYNKTFSKDELDEYKNMEYLIKLKFDQHEDIKKNLLNTGLRPLIYYTKNDDYWGIIVDENSGKNMLGKILMDLRNFYYEN